MQNNRQIWQIRDFVCGGKSKGGFGPDASETNGYELSTSWTIESRRIISRRRNFHNIAMPIYE